MRESLTVLAMLLIVVLTTALVGPYFVDWNAHRSEIEARLSGLVGAKVAVAGPIDVKLLPRPIFRMQDVSIAASDPQAATVTAERLDMELSLTALLRGDILFVDGEVTAPVVTLTVGSDGTIRLPRVADAAAADRVSLVHVALHGGTLVLQGSEGRPIATATGISGDGEATSLTGPFKFRGSVDTPSGPLTLSVGTGSLIDGRMRLKTSIDANGAIPKIDLDGTVTADAGTGDTRLSFDGSLATSGAVPFAGTTSVVPWRLAGKLHAEPGRLDLNDGEFRAGADSRAVIATAVGHVEGGERPAARLTLHARQADVGRLAVPPDQTGDQAAQKDPPPPDAGPPAGSTIADDIAALSTLVTNADLTAGLPLPVTIEAGVDTVTSGGLTLVDLQATTTLTAGATVAGTLSIGAPDGSRLTIEGALEPGPAAVFKGRVAASTPHLQRLADDLATDLPGPAAALRQALPFDAVQATGVVDLSGIGFAAHDVVVSLDRSKLAGTVTLTRGVGLDRPRLFADLTSDALDLDALSAWRTTARAVADLDVSLTLVAHALRVASPETAGLNAGRIAIQLNKSGSLLTLDRLSLADVGGATAEIKGQSDGTTAHAEARLDARNLRELLAVASRLAPGTITDRLVAGAEALSPALLTVAADARIDSDGGVTPTLLTIDGTAAATKVSVNLRPDVSGGAVLGSGTQAPFILALKLEAPDTGTLLRQAGLPTAPSTAIGRGRIDLSVHRDGTGTSQGTMTAALGETVLTADGRSDPAGHATGHVALKGPNMVPLARALLLAAPETGAIWPVDAAGAVAYADRRITAQGLAGKLIGTSFKSDLSYVVPASATSDVQTPSLTGSLAIDRLPLTVLAGLVLGPWPAVNKPNALWPDAPFAPATLKLPRSDIALTVPTLPLTGAQVAENAKMTVRLAPGAVTLADLSANFGASRIGGTVTLRRDGGSASLAGRLEWSALPIVSPSLGGLSGGALDLAGTGNSVAGVVASLAGTGTLAIENARLPRFDPGAVPRVIAGIDTAATTIDDDAIAQSLAQELDRGALALGSVTTPVTVAAGTMRVPPVRIQTANVRAEATGSLDLVTLLLSLRATASLATPPKDWVGSSPQVGAVWKGPFANPAREIDAATLVNGIAARAIARDQARIEAFQDDIRERGFFARRLRAIEAEQQAVRDKAKADADAAEKLRMQQLIQGVPSADATRLSAPGQTDPGRTGPPPPRRPPPPGSKPLDLH